jgi:hypothetical protein
MGVLNEKRCKSNFNKSDVFLKIIKPEICDILIPTDSFRNPWFNDENKLKADNNTLQIKLSREQKVKKNTDQNNKIVKDFIDTFNNLNNREPLDSEIIDNLKDKIDIQTILQIIDKNKLGFTNNV